MINNKILLDSDFIIALYLSSDSNHAKAHQIYTKYEDCSILSINMYEIATVLSRLLDQKEAVKIFDNLLSDFEDSVIDFERSWEKDIIGIYRSFSKKNISFVDCSVLYVAKEEGYRIASFDKFYPSEILA